MRGTTAGFNTPLFIVDTPSGKRDVHSAEFHDSEYGVSGFVSPAVAAGQMRHYFDPIRSLGHAAAKAWALPNARESILALVAAKAQPSTVALAANAARSGRHQKRVRPSSAREMPARAHAHQGEPARAGRHCTEPLRARANPAAEAHGSQSA